MAAPLGDKTGYSYIFLTPFYLSLFTLGFVHVDLSQLHFEERARGSTLSTAIFCFFSTFNIALLLFPSNFFCIIFQCSRENQLRWRSLHPHLKMQVLSGEAENPGICRHWE
ncbi:hypothetical protein BCR43DRAFT_46666 [Syncephalastrum racemosum]|uniref:Uncharacterized protein n=1 Tax=Syncephalastrum racemosum TaxID=13706 RepID=A0A1X2HUZ9_SYNRA|nr:hypothetical protein BCR43DRAFT_46666 [Syncephalastrum racemosum]